jgi:hypothetical protein
MGVTHRTAATDLAAGAWSMLSTATFTALAPIFRVYVPEGTTCPYAVIQNVTETPGWQTMGTPAKDCTFQLHVVSQSRGEVEANNILDAGVGILMRGFLGSTGTALTVANHAVMNVEYEGSDPFEEDDEGVLTFHRIGRFRVQLDQST